MLVVVGTLPPNRCGVGNYTRTLAAAFARRSDLEVAVMAVGGSPTIALPGWRWRDTFSILRRIRRWRPDLVHFQYPSFGYGRHRLPYVLPLLCRFMGLRVIETWHEPRPRAEAGDIVNARITSALIVQRQDFAERTSPRVMRILARKPLVFIPHEATIPLARLSDEQRARVRERFGANGRRLIAYFGFAYPHKGIEQLFEICDPVRDAIVLACELDERDEYPRRIRELAAGWGGPSVVTGYLAEEDAAEILAAADAVVLPFRGGSVESNSTVHGASLQGTFVLTTSAERRGYDPAMNVYAAKPDDLDELRAALEQYAGTRLEPRDPAARWDGIAAAHAELYRTVMAR